MSALSDFYDLLLPELPGCTTNMVDLHLREVVRDFCSRTSVWRKGLTAINLVANQDTYTMATPSDSEMVRVVSISAASELLWEDTESTDNLPKYARRAAPFVLSFDLTQIILDEDEVPTASLTGGLAITAALKPTASTAVLPDFIKAQYSEAIRHGVLSRLMMMKKPWGDRPLAMDYAAKWQSDLAFAAYQGQVGNTRKPLRVKKHL